MRQEPVHRFEADMVGIHVIRLAPTQFLHGGVRRRAGAGRFGADDQVFAVGFVPDGDDFDALLRGHDAGAQLGLRLMRKAVAHPKRKFFNFQRKMNN